MFGKSKKEKEEVRYQASSRQIRLCAAAASPRVFGLEKIAHDTTLTRPIPIHSPHMTVILNPHGPAHAKHMVT